MYLFLTIYGVLALIFLILFEVISTITNKELNAVFVRPIYQPNHFKIAVAALFFPIVLIIILVNVSTEYAMDRSEKK